MNISKIKIHSFSFVVKCLLLLSVVFCTSCGTTRKVGGKNNKKLVQQIEQSPVFSKIFTGFVLFDPANEKVIYEHESDKYYTPASNTKIFTLYTALHILGDSLPALKYIVRGDSLIFWGMGDPSFNHPDLPRDSTIYNFLKKRSEKLFFSSHNFMDVHLGPGWSWDDYPYYFQPEKSAMPFHGNFVSVERNAFESNLKVDPPYFNDVLIHQPGMAGVRRDYEQNIFRFDFNKQTKYKNELPFKYSDELFVQLLSAHLQKRVQLLTEGFMPPADSKIIYSTNIEASYQRLMKQSDNFIAEQLLLSCSAIIFDTMQTRKMIDYSVKNLLADLPDKPVWRDGSGVSRYNLFTPRSIVKLLHKIYQEESFERIKNIFAEGGVSGTIKNWYGADTPYVYAKTGTLSNKHCLSGFLITKSGKTLIFSFMNNNYINGSSEVKAEMMGVLEFIREGY